MWGNSELPVYHPYNYRYCIELYLIEMGLGLQHYVTW